VVADHLRLDGCGVDGEMARQMHAEALAVEQRAGAEHAVVAGTFARHVGERIGRIGDTEQHRVGRGAHDARNDVAVNRGVLVGQAQPPLRIVAVGGAAGLPVDAGRDHHQRAAGEVGVVAVRDRDLRRERRAVAEIGRHRLGALARAVDQHEVARAAAGDAGERAGAAHPADADNADLAHGFRPSGGCRVPLCNDATLPGLVPFCGF
jgi:hypothetical protein